MSGVESVTLPGRLGQALSNAGARSGVDFDYLLRTAMRESALDPEAEASTSTATGLFQFLEETWLEVVREEGARLGYQNIARHIQKTANGYEVADPEIKAAILSLRKDPEMSSDMAAAFTRRNGEYLAAKFGRTPSSGELYIAHFMGARGAERFFQLGLTNPGDNAARHFPAQARANRQIFFDGGQPRTIKEVYQVLVANHRPDKLNKPLQHSAEFAVQQMATDTSRSGLPANGKSMASISVSRYQRAQTEHVPGRFDPTSRAEPATGPARNSERVKQFFERFQSK